MLDYVYIEQCQDISVLRAIYENLLRNENGKFPDLEYATKMRLSALLPEKENEQGKVNAKQMTSQEEVDREKTALQNWIECTNENATSIDDSASECQKRNQSSQPQLVAPRINDESQEEDFTAAEKKFMSEIEKERGNELFRIGDMEECMQCYTKSILLDATNAKSFANRALARMKCSPPDLQGAIDDCNAALEIDLNYIKAYVRRGTLLDKLGRYDEAVKDFEVAHKLDVNGGYNSLAESSREKLIAQREKMLRKNSLQIVEVDGIGEDELGNQDDFDYIEEIAPGAIESMSQATKTPTPKSTNGFATNLKKFFSSKAARSAVGSSSKDVSMDTENWCRIDISHEGDSITEDSDSVTVTSAHKIDTVAVEANKMTNHDSQTLCF